MLLASSTISFAQVKKTVAAKDATTKGATYVTKVENITEYKMPNGMQVLLIPDATQNNVLVNIVYKVGSRNEGYGETGMAHLLEHMLFKGTKRIKEIKKAIADKGASANGTTWYDRTNYYEILPASDDNLKWALDMEADRMVNSTILQTELDKEFSVVRNEFESGENNPSGILEERIMSTMFLWHNYGKSTIGSKEDIEKVPATSLKVFYQKYYQPDNATLIVAGKFDPAKTIEWINQYFGIVPKPSRIISPTYTVEPPQDGERYVELRRNGDLPNMGVGYHTPSHADKDFASNMALVEMLTNEPSGYLYKSLVETKLCTKVWGYSQVLQDPGFTFFATEIPKDHDVKEVKRAFLGTFNALDTMKFSQKALERAKNSLIKDYENVYNNTIYFGINLTEEIGAGNYKLWFINRDRVENLTLNDVQGVAKKYYKPSNRTYGIFYPDKNPERVKVGNTPDINALTENYKGKEVKEMTETFEPTVANIKAKAVYGNLKNGMKYAILRKPAKGDKIFANIQLYMGDEKSLSGKNDVAYLASRMLKYGTTTRSRKDINDELDKNKSSINFGGGANMLYVSLNTDKEHFEKAMDLLQDMLLHPSFDVKEFDKLMLDAKADLESSMSDPSTLASEALTKAMNKYPVGHPFYPRTSKEQLEALKGVTIEQIKEYYTNFYGANNGYASFVGSVDVDQIKKLIEKSLGGWNSKATFKDIEEKYFEVNGDLKTIQVDDKANATLMGGININLTQKDPDFIALAMANEMLGGGAFLSSRIPQRLREAEGMSYGAGSFLDLNYRYPSGSLGFYAIFNPSFKDKLNSALKEEISKALDKGFTKEELKSSLESWLQQRKMALDNNNGLASMLTRYMVDGKNLDFYTETETKAKALTLEQINAALKKYLDPNKIIFMYAGDFRKKD